jgi:hypothetical protein
MAFIAINTNELHQPYKVQLAWHSSQARTLHKFEMQ